MAWRPWSRSDNYRAENDLTIGMVETVDDLAGESAPIEIIAVGPNGSRSADQAPDVVACRSALGPLLLGTNASELARARRLRADEHALRRADVLLGTGVASDCRTHF